LDINGLTYNLQHTPTNSDALFFPWSVTYSEGWIISIDLGVGKLLGKKAKKNPGFILGLS